MSAIDEILSIGEENLNAESLQSLLQFKKEIIAYDGFEPSGRIHICQGLFRVDNINKMTKHGIKFKIWIADWFAQLNHKLGGDINKIKKAGLLMIHTWKACGLTDPDKVEFVWASEEISKRSEEYWKLMMDISTKTTLKRTLRCTPAMGRESLENAEENELNPLYASNVFYPIMQCVDIFFLKVDICSLGMDQRKVNMLALEYCDKINKKYKPIVLSHHMIMGLNGSTKMAKSDPDNAIFMDDDISEIKRKVKKGYCVLGDITTNPIVEYMKYLIFPAFPEIIIDRKESDGGDIKYSDYDKFENDYKEKLIHPSDLKNCLIKYLNIRLEPVRKYFENNTEAKKLSEEVKNSKK